MLKLRQSHHTPRSSYCAHEERIINYSPIWVWLCQTTVKNSIPRFLDSSPFILPARDPSSLWDTIRAKYRSTHTSSSLTIVTWRCWRRTPWRRVHPNIHTQVCVQIYPHTANAPNSSAESHLHSPAKCSPCSVYHTSPPPSPCTVSGLSHSALPELHQFGWS